MADLIIRGGTVVDGTGAAPRRADVVVSGGLITDVVEPGAEVAGVTDATRIIDATGRVVTPGFVDIHTHLDAQLFWDASGSSSCFHGVTTLVLGNCGVTFAPVRPGDERYFAEMMEAVEDIPADTIMEGMDWGWESFGDYLAALRGRPLGLNVGGLIGHCALRYYVMGERSLSEDPATPEEIAEMARLVAEAVEAGALGFSTSRSFMHTVPDGRPVPGTFADLDELAAIGAALGAIGRGTIEVVPRIGERDGADRQNSTSELAWMEQVSRDSGRPLTFAMMQSNRRPDLWEWVMGQVGEARARGANLRPQTTARGTGILYGLAGRTPWDALDAWAALMERDVEGRLAALGDTTIFDLLVAEAAEPRELSGALAPKDPAAMYLLPTGSAAYDVSPENSLAAEAERRGVTPAEAFLRFSLETEGRGLLYYPVLNQDQDAVAAMLVNPDVVVGVADAGAHVGMTMDAGQATYLLKHWVRDLGLLPLETAIHKLTLEGAQLFGITDRGAIRAGQAADINVIDLDRLDLFTPELIADFPLGAERYVQRGQGYDFTIVNGVVTIEGDELTGAFPGTVVTPA